MKRLVPLVVALALPFTATGREEDAKTLAQALLDKGAAQFEQRDAAAMTANYTDDGMILWVYRDNSTGQIKVDVKKGHAEIEALYRDTFKDPNERTTSRNTVGSARFIASDVMIIEGNFQPNVARNGKYPFVQVRVKRDGKWLLKTLEFFVISQD